MDPIPQRMLPPIKTGFAKLVGEMEATALMVQPLLAVTVQLHARLSSMYDRPDVTSDT